MIKISKADIERKLKVLPTMVPLIFKVFPTTEFAMLWWYRTLDAKIAAFNGYQWRLDDIVVMSNILTYKHFMSSSR